MPFGVMLRSKLNAFLFLCYFVNDLRLAAVASQHMLDVAPINNLPFGESINEAALLCSFCSPVLHPFICDPALFSLSPIDLFYVLNPQRLSILTYSISSKNLQLFCKVRSQRPPQGDVRRSYYLKMPIILY